MTASSLAGTFDPRWTSLACGLLADFQAAGILTAADIHVAIRLGRLGGEADEGVLLAAALTVRAARLGSVCLDLAAAPTQIVRAEDDETDVTDVTGKLPESSDLAESLESLPWPEPAVWNQACAASPLVATAPAREGGCPLRFIDGLLYLDRYWQQEELVARELTGRAARSRDAPPALDADRFDAALNRLFPPMTGGEPDHQREAAAVAARRWLTVLAGGPGTGKTTTVARVLALLADQPGPAPHIALAAPTGKAAARLEEAVRDAIAGLPAADRLRLGELSASTLHRLLGFRPGSRSRFSHHAGNRLAHDIVVVDESSMISLTLMARLLDAVRPDARLVLVGDPEQLASVEAGAVLGDIVDAATPAETVPAETVPAETVPAETVPAEAVFAVAVPAEAAAGGLGEVDGGRAVGGVLGGGVGGVLGGGVGGVLGGGVGSVLGNRVGGGIEGVGSGFDSGIVVLQRSWRFTGRIAELAAAIQAGDADTVMTLLRTPAQDVSFVEADAAVGGASGGAEALIGLRDDVLRAARHLIAAARAADASAALRLLGAHRLLCAHRHGPYGADRWGAELERWIDSALTVPRGAWDWYPGRPLLVTANDYEVKLFNGDTGVVINDGAGAITAAFGRASAPVLIRPARLGAVQTMQAMTVHRSQGSQFERVSVLLPAAGSPLLSRQLLYTAVTRAERHVRIIGSQAAVRAAVTSPITRASGLRGRLWSGGAGGRSADPSPVPSDR